ncbi:hypothetical protein H1R20_g31, partial [Candolleomyces eurysporus]
MDAGAAIHDILWHPQAPRTILIAAAHGIVSCLEFSCGDSDAQQDDRTTAIKVKGFINGMAMDEGGTTVAVAFDMKVQMVPFPFHDGNPTSFAEGPSLPIQATLRGPFDKAKDLSLVPIKYQPIPLQIHFLSRTSVRVTSLAGAQGFELDQDVWHYKWTLPALAGSCMGATAISPSGNVLVSTNLKNEVDWYSLPLRKHQMTTHGEFGVSKRNFILETQFLDETTIVTGHNLGQVPVATKGNIHVSSYLGTKGRHPSQSISAIVTETNVIIAAAIGTGIVLWTIEGDSSIFQSRAHSSPKVSVSSASNPRLERQAISSTSSRPVPRVANTGKLHANPAGNFSSRPDVDALTARPWTRSGKLSFTRVSYSTLVGLGSLGSLLLAIWLVLPTGTPIPEQTGLQIAHLAPRHSVTEGFSSASQYFSTSPSLILLQPTPTPLTTLLTERSRFADLEDSQDEDLPISMIVRSLCVLSIPKPSVHAPSTASYE